MITIEEIQTGVNLLKKANCKSYVTLNEISKELHIRKIDLMLFIENNPKLFNISERWVPKTKTVIENRFGAKFKTSIQVRGKHLGLCIDAAYIHAHENYLTDEWLEKAIIEKVKYLHITEANNYGSITGYYIEIDENKDSDFREYAWRNTIKKIESIKEYFHEGCFFVGGYGDSYSYVKKYSISFENIRILKELGWTFNDFKPLTS
jgi:hypothetical protein